MNRKKNAFTLIELLAIIVILAIIAVITVPIILNIIENSKKGAVIDSAYGYKDAVSKAYITELSKPNQGGLKLNGTYEVQDDGTLEPADSYSFGVTNYNTLPVSVSGDKPSSGTLTYENNVLTGGWLVIGDYKVTFKQDGSVEKTEKNTGSSSNNQENGGNSEQQTGTPLAIGTVVAYSTTLNNVTLNNWKVFYVDGDYTYLILDYYIPSSCISDEMISTYDLNVSNYSVTGSRTNLINAMTTTSNWSELINNGSINGRELSAGVKSDANVWAMGSPTVELWVNSWNAKHTSNTLYIAQTEYPMNDGLYGYYIGESENTTSDYVFLSEQTDTLYFLDADVEMGANGYWYYYLASPSGLDEYELMYVQPGAVGYGWYDGHYGELPTLRPVIKLPTSVVNQ